MTLFRVIPQQIWHKTQTLGFVPRCGNDLREDCVHLNVKEAVTFSANRYFTLEEAPMVIEVDTAEFENALEWLPPTENEPWTHPRANISNIPLASVIATHVLQYDGEVFSWQDFSSP